jgi:cell division septum initiation protein DivIVA
MGGFVEDIKEKIEQVLGTEDEAKSTIENAQKEKEHLLSEAHQKVKEMLASAREEAGAIIAGQKKLIEEETSAEIDGKRRRTNEEIQSLIALGQKNIASAVSFIVGSLIKPSLSEK